MTGERGSTGPDFPSSSDASAGGPQQARSSPLRRHTHATGDRGRRFLGPKGYDRVPRQSDPRAPRRVLRRRVRRPPRLIWFNFAHLFSVSLLPLATAWMAVSELAPQPVAFYASVFFLVNATYMFLIWELIDPAPVDDVSPRVRRIMHVRSIAPLCLFGLAAIVALKYPLIGLGICCCCLIVYLRPEAPRGGHSTGR